MIILIGCEESQAVTIALRALGHEAYSCDLKPCSGGHPEWHLQMDVFEALMLKKWEAFMFFPDCTFITVSGLHWNKRIPGRSKKTQDALQFVCRLWNIAIRLGIKHIAMENPIGCISTQIMADLAGHRMVKPESAGGGGVFVHALTDNSAVSIRGRRKQVNVPLAEGLAIAHQYRLYQTAPCVQGVQKSQ